MINSGMIGMPLHFGKMPRWLTERMGKMGSAIIESVAQNYGKSEVLTRLSDPNWFQALGAVMGMQELFSGLGFMLGPPIGGLLYARGGFSMPFLVLGIMLLSVLFFLPCVLRRTAAGEAPAEEAGTVEAARAGVIDAVDYLEQAVLRFGIVSRQGARAGGGTAGSPVAKRA